MQNKVWNILQKDITAGIKRPKKEKRIPVVLSQDEVQKLLRKGDLVLVKASRGIELDKVVEEIRYRIQDIGEEG